MNDYDYAQRHPVQVNGEMPRGKRNRSHTVAIEPSLEPQLRDLMVWIYLIIFKEYREMTFDSYGPVEVCYEEDSVALGDPGLHPWHKEQGVTDYLDCWKKLLLETPKLFLQPAYEYRLYLRGDYLQALTSREKLMFQVRFVAWARQHGLDPARYGVVTEAIEMV